MKKNLLYGLIILSIKLFSQSDETIDWINNNSILIEDSDPNSELISFHNQLPVRFENARIYGFGEHSHDGKEYFNLKAKYFKYLVVNHNVKAFMIEDSFGSEESINLWINNLTDDFDLIKQSFTIGFWYSTEIYELLNWMRKYNRSRPENDRIKYFAIDTQSAKNLNQNTIEIINQHNIPIEKELFENFLECQQKKLNWKEVPNWADDRVYKLEQLKKDVNQYFETNKIDSPEMLKKVNREIEILINYTEYVQQPNNEFRDRQMFENIDWILENELSNEKVFLWAHNEHINKRGMWSYNSGIRNLGSFLKNKYQEDYYCVGFDFGIGSLKGYNPKKKSKNGWVLHKVEKPYKKTYSETLFKANKDIYFIDLKDAEISEPNRFFSSINQTLSIGAGGFQPKPLYKIKMLKIYTDDYDALIFVKEISPADNIIKIE